MRKTAATITVILTAFVLCGQVSLAQTAPPPPSFRNFVVVGDSLLAGFANGSLNARGQQEGIAAVIARQIGTFMMLPLIPEPGIPNELQLVDPGPPPVVEPKPGDVTSSPRIFPLVIPQNLAVPGQNVLDALTLRPDLTFDGLEDIILGIPSLVVPQLEIPPLSQIETAFVLQPTFTVFWLGSNDFLSNAINGGVPPVTPFPVFQEAFTQALGAVLLTGSQVVVANIPDVTVIPFLLKAEEVAALAGAPLAAIGPVLGIESGDFVMLNAVSQVLGILSGQVPGPLPDAAVLSVAEVVPLRAAIAAANGFIGQLSALLGFPVVDIHSFLNQVDAEGLEAGGQVLTTDFLGGVFGLDGIHPTATGSAVAANRFVEKINEFWGLSISLADINAIAAQDPLVFGLPPGTQSASLPSLATDTSALQPVVELLTNEGQGRGTDVEGAGEDPELETRRGLLSAEEFIERLQRLSSVRVRPGPALFPELRDGGRGKVRIPSRLPQPN